MAAHGWDLLGFVLASALLVGMLGLLVRKWINDWRMRTWIKDAQVKLDLVDLGPVHPEYFFRPKHGVCNQIFRLGRMQNGKTRRYCALCEGIEEGPHVDDMADGTVVHVASRDGKLVRTPPRQGPPPAA